MGTGHSDLDRLTGDDPRLRVGWLVWTVLAIAALTVVGLGVLWPSDTLNHDSAEIGLVSDAVEAKVAGAAEIPCSYATERRCQAVTYTILAGRDAGTVATQEFEISSLAPYFEEGQRVILSVIDGADPLFRYQYSDRERRPLLLALGAVFALAVVGLGRLRGVAALGGLAASVFVLVAFIAPSILSGNSPVLVAAVGGSAIALLALYLAHGWQPLTHVAAIGTFGALVVTLGVSTAVIALAQFSGFASEEAIFLTFVDGLQVNGLILAGTVLGAIGALDDITVTQASTVFELRRLQPEASTSELLASGIRVGRDHIASTVNTLLLAYAGAAMPLMLLFTLSDLPLGIVANSEVVAVEIVRTLAGSIGLVSAVPLTTWLAARIVGAQQ